jgi:hypothetical protein
MTRNQSIPPEAKPWLVHVSLVSKHLSVVMAGLVPAIQAFVLAWMRGTSPRMTKRVIRIERNLL